MSEMGNRIRELRMAKGWTQEQLGEKVGLQKSAIAKYENGKTENMKRSVIQKMAEVLGVSPSYLMGFDEAYHGSYYIDDDTRELAQELVNRPEIKVLFSASRGATKEDIEAVAMILEKMTKRNDD